MTDPDLQKLIDAKKSADQKKADDAEKSRLAGIRAQEERTQADVDWKDLLIVANAEAGRVNSVMDQTGIKISGLQGSPGIISISYRLMRQKTALEIDVIFIKQNNIVEVRVAPTKNVPALTQIRYTKHFPSAKKVDVRSILNDIARQLIEA